MKQTCGVLLLSAVLVFLMVCDSAYGKAFLLRHDEITDGDAYGFHIGWEKGRCYSVVRTMMENDAKVELTAPIIKEIELDKFPGSFEFRNATGIADQQFELWNTWRIHSTDIAPNELVDLVFFDEKLIRISVLPRGDRAELYSVESLELGGGQQLVVGSSRGSTLENLKLNKGVKVQPLLKTKRFPVRGTEKEYEYIRDNDIWMILLEGAHSDSVWLEFSDDALVKITRHKGELP